MNRITETDYDKLCSACDALLNKNPSSITRNVNSSLHVIREHPIFLSSYQSIFEKNDLKFYTQLLKQLLRNIVVGTYKLIHSIYRNFILNDRYKSGNVTADYLFISHFLNEDFLKQKNDFYFFDLPKKIVNQDENSLQLYINFTGLSTSKIQKKWKNRKPHSLALPRYLPFLGELNARFLFLKEAFSLLVEKTNSPLEKRVKLLAAVGALSSSTFSNFRIAKWVQFYIKRQSPKYLFTTYEGHAWERLIFFLARKVNKEIKCIGYQHALIFRKQHAIRRKLNNQFEPDFIMCSGIHAKQQFTSINYLPKERLLLFGSNRTTDSKRDNLAVEAKKRDTFLMLSEGDLIECIPLVQLILDMAKKNNHLKFIIRFHPITKISKVLQRCPGLTNPPANLFLSDKSFEEDLERAHFAVYRGSTTIIKAVQYGLVPLYFQRENEISIDPLFEMQKAKINIKKAEDLEQLFLLNEESLKNNQLKMIDFVDQFFSPIDYSIAEQLKLIP